jgi:hypothetical protein
MSIYTPDSWVIIEINSKAAGIVRKVLASWYGGFSSSDSWKLSSGNTGIIETADAFEIAQHSGSTYICGKKCHGMSGYTSSVLAGWQLQLAETDAGTIRVLEKTEAFQL